MLLWMFNVKHVLKEACFATYEFRSYSGVRRREKYMRYQDWMEDFQVKPAGCCYD